MEKPMEKPMKSLQKMSVERKRERGLSGDWWKNDLYRVLVVRGRKWDDRPVIQISIERCDKKPIDPPWRDKQAIKNQLVHPEREGVEIYPAENAALIDERNKYHLWVIDDPNFRFTDLFGFKGGRVTEATNAAIEKGEIVNEEEE